jgi:hypothetical protein
MHYPGIEPSTFGVAVTLTTAPLRLHKNHSENSKLMVDTITKGTVSVLKSLNKLKLVIEVVNPVNEIFFE